MRVPSLIPADARAARGDEPQLRPVVVELVERGIAARSARSIAGVATRSTLARDAIDPPSPRL